jgi:hypothetical protein
LRVSQRCRIPSRSDEWKSLIRQLVIPSPGLFVVERKCCALG